MVLSRSLDTAEAVNAEERLQEKLLELGGDSDDCEFDDPIGLEASTVGSPNFRTSVAPNDPSKLLGQTLFETAQAGSPLDSISRRYNDSPHVPAEMAQGSQFDIAKEQLAAGPSSLSNPAAAGPVSFDANGDSNMFTTLLTQQMLSSPRPSDAEASAADAAAAVPAAAPAAVYAVLAEPARPPPLVAAASASSSTVTTGPSTLATGGSEEHRVTRSTGSVAETTTSITLPGPVHHAAPSPNTSGAGGAPTLGSPEPTAPETNQLSPSETQTAEASNHPEPSPADTNTMQEAQKPSLWSVWMMNRKNKKGAKAAACPVPQKTRSSQKGWMRGMFREDTSRHVFHTQGSQETDGAYLPEQKLPGEVSSTADLDNLTVKTAMPEKLSVCAEHEFENLPETPGKESVKTPGSENITGTITPCTYRSEGSVYETNVHHRNTFGAMHGMLPAELSIPENSVGIDVKRSAEGGSEDAAEAPVEGGSDQTLEGESEVVSEQHSPFDGMPVFPSLKNLSLDEGGFGELGGDGNDEDDKILLGVSQPGEELSLVNQELHMPDAEKFKSLSLSLEPIPVSETTSAHLWPRATAVTRQNMFQGLFSMQRGEKGAQICPIRGGDKVIADMDLHLGRDGMIILGPSCKDFKFRNVAFLGGVVVCRGSTCDVVFEDASFTHCTLVATEGAKVTLMHAKFNNLAAHAPQCMSDPAAARSGDGASHAMHATMHTTMDSSTQGIPRTPSLPLRELVAIYACNTGTKVTAGDVTIRGGLQGVAAHNGAQFSGVRMTCIACEVLGVEVRGSGELSLRSCIFRNILKYKQTNSADATSTGILVQSKSTGTISGTKTRNCGAGLVLRRAVATAQECQFVAGFANCVHVFQQSRLTVEDSVMAESLEGNGLIVSGEKSSAEVKKCRFVRNKGAGLCVAKDARVQVHTCLASENGTCGFLVSKSKLEVRDCECESNRTGVSAQTSARLLAQCVIVRNSSLGGFHIFSSSADLKDCVAEDCAGDGINASYAMPAMPSANGTAVPVVTIMGGHMHGNGECGVRSYRSVVRGENVKTVGNKLCGFMAKGEEAHITLKQCRSEDDLTYKERNLPACALTAPLDTLGNPICIEVPLDTSAALMHADDELAHSHKITDLRAMLAHHAYDMPNNTILSPARSKRSGVNVYLPPSSAKLAGLVPFTPTMHTHDELSDHSPGSDWVKEVFNGGTPWIGEKKKKDSISKAISKRLFVRPLCGSKVLPLPSPVKSPHQSGHGLGAHAYDVADTPLSSASDIYRQMCIFENEMPKKSRKAHKGVETAHLGGAMSIKSTVTMTSEAAEHPQRRVHAWLKVASMSSPGSRDSQQQRIFSRESSWKSRAPGSVRSPVTPNSDIFFARFRKLTVRIPERTSIHHGVLSATHPRTHGESTPMHAPAGVSTSAVATGALSAPGPCALISNEIVALSPQTHAHHASACYSSVDSQRVGSDHSVQYSTGHMPVLNAGRMHGTHACKPDTPRSHRDEPRTWRLDIDPYGHGSELLSGLPELPEFPRAFTTVFPVMHESAPLPAVHENSSQRLPKAAAATRSVYRTVSGRQRVFNVSPAYNTDLLYRQNTETLMEEGDVIRLVADSNFDNLRSGFSTFTDSCALDTRMQTMNNLPPSARSHGTSQSQWGTIHEESSQNIGLGHGSNVGTPLAASAQLNACSPVSSEESPGGHMLVPLRHTAHALAAMFEEQELEVEVSNSRAPSSSGAGTTRKGESGPTWAPEVLRIQKDAQWNFAHVHASAPLGDADSEPYARIV